MEDIPLYKGKTKNILVISGGGLKGFSALGALTKLKELEIIDNPEIFCGTSAGACISLLLLIGYSPLDIYEILSELDMKQMVISNIDNILDEINIGLNLCDPIIYVIGHMIKKKGFSVKSTFEDLYNKTKKKLIITGVCLNDSSLHYFSYETTPQMNILKAITISISIPIIFKPCLYNNKLWVDGGVMNNYPIEIFNDKINDVIGIYMGEEYNEIEHFEEVQSYIYQILRCIFRGMNYTKLELYKENTIHIKAKNYSFGIELSKKDISELYLCGYNTVSKKYET
jgi:predicted acylesterase/phospholipase RssA